MYRDCSALADFALYRYYPTTLHREIVNAIANLSVRNKDDALKTILTQQGITINVNPQTKPAQAPEAKSRR